MALPATSFTLAPAVRADIPRLAEIHVRACLPSNVFGLYFDSPAEFDRRVRDMLEEQIGKSNWIHTKVIHNSSNQIAA